MYDAVAAPGGGEPGKVPHSNTNFSKAELLVSTKFY